jgi:hypothetical protein
MSTPNIHECMASFHFYRDAKNSAFPAYKQANYHIVIQITLSACLLTFLSQPACAYGVSCITITIVADEFTDFNSVSVSFSGAVYDQRSLEN